VKHVLISLGPNTFERLTKQWYSIYDIVRDTNMPEAFERGTSWLQNCLENHACGPGTHIDWLPTRLIDLKARSPGSINVVYLVERPSERSPYAALSYCWGRDLQGVTRTLLANKETHVDGIPVGTMPKTIQDAIRVCNGLRIRYLWVDSFCIVQDDLDDWEREAAMMSSVYRFAQVTICAHAAASCKDGFLGPQVYGQPAWQRAFYTTSQGTPGFKFFLRNGQRYRTQRGTVPSVLDTRGWALQEAILSPRLLHYTGNDMVWECGGAHFCECGHVEGFSEDDTRLMTKTEFARAGRDPEEDDERIGQWMSMITQYSRRSLTKASDKLVAIRGLANLVWGVDFEKGLGQYPLPTYISGMFNKGFLEQLLWHTMISPGMNEMDFEHPNSEETDFEYQNSEVSASSVSASSVSAWWVSVWSAEGKYPKPTRMCPSVAPSWSWASIDGQIAFALKPDGTDWRFYVKIIGSNEFLGISELAGEIRARDLILEGLVVPVAMKRLLRMNRHEGNGGTMWTEDKTFVRHADGRVYSCEPDVDMDVQIFMGDSAYNCWSSAEFHSEGASSLLPGVSSHKRRRPLPESEGSVDYGSWGRTVSRSSGGYLMRSTTWNSDEHTDGTNEANDQICRSGTDSPSSSQEREDQAAMERSYGTGIDIAYADARSDKGEEHGEGTWYALTMKCHPLVYNLIGARGKAIRSLLMI
jgi:hypothetical protein